jgi:hypothetical protein
MCNSTFERPSKFLLYSALKTSFLGRYLVNMNIRTPKNGALEMSSKIRGPSDEPQNMK